ncbi:unnamed protein product [Scytosiphon promiscuus]
MRVKVCGLCPACFWRIAVLPHLSFGSQRISSDRRNEVGWYQMSPVGLVLSVMLSVLIDVFCWKSLKLSSMPIFSFVLMRWRTYVVATNRLQRPFEGGP